ncbi:MAG: DUF2384 domain-containing protein [Erythrobacter sp.]|nr:DUF2384 domain-containing protein [Erythrobacter sp.]
MRKTDSGRVAFRAFFKIAKIWGLTKKEQLRMLGEPEHTTFDAWRRGHQTEIGRDTLERISYVLGIYRAINTLLPDKKIAAAWIRKPNDAPIFGGASAADRMAAGNVSDLYAVRQYLDAEASPPDLLENRKFGALKGEIWIADDFEETLGDIIDAMEGR